MFGPLNVFRSLPEASSTHSATAQQSPQGSSMKGLCAVVGIGTTAVLHSVLKMNVLGKISYILLLCLCPDISTKRTLLLLNLATGFTNLALVPSFYCPPADHTLLTSMLTT